MKFRIRLSIAVASLLLIYTCLSANAQLTESTLKGIVLDATGSVVQQANILATNESTGISRKTISGDDGSFTIPDLPPGSYTLEVKAQGYKTFEQSHLQLNVGVTAEANVRLEIGKVEETVQVTAEQAQVPVSTDGRDYGAAGSRPRRLLPHESKRRRNKHSRLLWRGKADKVSGRYRQWKSLSRK